MAYDIPFCTHVKLRRATIVELAQEGTIIGLKDSSGEDREFRQVLLDLAGHPDFFGFTGAELVVDSALAMGAHGVVPGLGNVDPAGYVRLWNAFKRGDLAEARREQERLCILSEINGDGPVPYFPGVSVEHRADNLDETAFDGVQVSTGWDEHAEPMR